MHKTNITEYKGCEIVETIYTYSNAATEKTYWIRSPHFNFQVISSHAGKINITKQLRIMYGNEKEINTSGTK